MGIEHPAKFLSPTSARMRIYAGPLHRSEIMTSGWCSGDRVGWQSCCLRRKPSRQGPVRRSSRYHARAALCGAAQGAKPGTHEPGGSKETRCWHSGRRPSCHRSRDAAGDAPRPWWHRPKTPAGRRGVSLIHCGLPHRGKRLAGPASSSSTRGSALKTPKPKGCRALQCAPIKPPHRPSSRRKPGPIARTVGWARTHPVFHSKLGDVSESG